MLVPFEANCTTVQFLPLNFTNHQHQILLLFKNCCYLPPQGSVCVKLKTYVLLLSGDSLFVGEQPLVIHSSQRWQAYFHSASIGERVKHVSLGLSPKLQTPPTHSLTHSRFFLAIFVEKCNAQNNPKRNINM